MTALVWSDHLVRRGAIALVPPKARHAQEYLLNDVLIKTMPRKFSEIAIIPLPFANEHLDVSFTRHAHETLRKQ